MSEYVKERIAALRREQPGAFQNVACARTNAMRYLPNYFGKGQLQKLFFLFPDPHFKASCFNSCCQLLGAVSVLNLCSSCLGNAEDAQAMLNQSGSSAACLAHADGTVLSRKLPSILRGQQATAYRAVGIALSRKCLLFTGHKPQAAHHTDDAAGGVRLPARRGRHAVHHQRRAGKSVALERRRRTCPCAS